MARIRLLQTSDVHLRDDRPERMRALELAFREVEQRSVDAVLICGDLFDRASDAASGRPRVRALIEGIAPRPVFLIPGNHDEEAYGPENDYGTNAKVLAGTPYSRVEALGLEFVGLPYQHGKAASECLTGLDTDARSTVLLAHGTLVDDGLAAFAGEGEEGFYMPLFEADLDGRASYAALGHLHSGKRLVTRHDERLFAYAGSPVATSRRELGPRGVLIVDFEAGAGVLGHEFVPLATPYYERIEQACVPGREDQAIDDLARRAGDARAPGARVLATLGGVSTIPEAHLRRALDQALARVFQQRGDEQADRDDPTACFPIIDLRTSSYQQLAEIPVVGEFVARLATAAEADGAVDEETLAEAMKLGLEAFLESLP